MLYLNTKDIDSLGIDWEKNIGVIHEAVELLKANDFDQPIKPYLSFDNPRNRIIAMPARAGGDIATAGIKWIASFPENIEQGIPRANSVTILNSDQTGVPVAVINTPLVSGIRTASVSGLLLKQYQKQKNLRDITLGITGFGPIGQLHLKMAHAILGDDISKVRLYDLKGINETYIPEELREKVEVCDSWEAAYQEADVFITCTVSSKGYIDKKPKDGSLLLNVSLRDFAPEILDYTKALIVDNWEEVCRANTDIEVFHKTRGLQKEDTLSIVEAICDGGMAQFPEDQAIMFHPMGMALFDIAISTRYYQQALEQGVGKKLED